MLSPCNEVAKGVARAVMLAGILAVLSAGMAWSEENIFLAATRDKAALERAINVEQPAFRPPPGVTGITVPHHLLAADLIARGFWAASAGNYKRIIVISPDHFRRVKAGFGIDDRAVDTVFGMVTADTTAIASLAAKADLFRPIDLSTEHGIQAILPFVAKFFPEAKVIPVVASVGSSPADWLRAAQGITLLIDDETLVVQSTDYSHYLPVEEAVRRDQETLVVASSGDAEAIVRLNQPQHMDSRAAEYIQAYLQFERLAAAQVVVANRSSTEYGGSDEITTSYLVKVFHRDPRQLSVLRYGDQAVAYFAGDTLLGRFLSPILRDEHARSMIVDGVLSITLGAPLIINLEGPLLREPVAGLGSGTHAMLIGDAGTTLRELNVTAASLANNHAFDLGEAGFVETLDTLRSLGIVALQHNEVSDLGGFRILPLTFLLNRPDVGSKVERPEQLSESCHADAKAPLVAFLHWGEEKTSQPREAEFEAMQRLAACGISLAIGAHSHVASSRPLAIAGSMLSVYSLGNFLYDQRSARSSGALFEVRIFRQGTLAGRLIPIPNFFELGQKSIGGNSE